MTGAAMRGIPPCRMPAEWEPHDATWIAWPHHEPDWPGKFEPIHWVYAEIVRVLSGSERVEILCHDEATRVKAAGFLEQNGVGATRYRLHKVANDRSWLRDSAPTAVHTTGGEIVWIQWRFNAWAKYDNYRLDEGVPRFIAEATGLERVEALRPDNGLPFVLEGGGIDTDGGGTLLVTEECFLSEQQCRNPGLSREGYEEAFARYLGIRKTVWLGRGCVGDDTHGHIDDLARFVAPATVVLAYEDNVSDGNHEMSVDNLERLKRATDAAGRSLTVVTIPMPEPVLFGGERLPASYANFYIANSVVVVPTFNDPNDRVVLATLAGLFPNRRVVGIHCRDLILGLGTLHCLSQQQPAALGR
ncbi:MAG TPA: agmatine deiminase family protein [Phycisphaerae bacterium]|nr:agmatine deiminase family protein [Phycisphaerae bacterium]HRY67155.1 agmatine deiminase family protein [Phycisphaerae bacterium]HSA26476.1 agmatine deiminase family protein [Phycisphaerae bacterium]